MKILVSKMNKRGISPLIATVLLVSFVVILASVILFWGKQYVTELMEKKGEVAAIKLECEGNVGMEILGVSSDGVTIRNTGTNKINGFILKFDNGDSGQDNSVLNSYDQIVIDINRYIISGTATQVNIIPLVRPAGIGAPPIPEYRRLKYE